LAALLRSGFAALRGPVLGHFATRDKWINRDMVGGFEAAMAQAGKAVASHWYEAEHAFANPTSARYDEADAQLAWQRTLEFFKANL
jgi:carboxymethylenebutenolidase